MAFLRRSRRFPLLGQSGAETMTGTLAAYLAMGGYAGFVWPAYAITAVVLGGLAIQSWRRYRASRDALTRLTPPAGNRE